MELNVGKFRYILSCFNTLKQLLEMYKRQNAKKKNVIPLTITYKFRKSTKLKMNLSPIYYLFCCSFRFICCILMWPVLAKNMNILVVGRCTSYQALIRGYFIWYSFLAYICNRFTST